MTDTTAPSASTSAAAPARDHIFISYRRHDSRGASGRLYDWLRIAFGRERVFRDVHSIGAGRWRDKIDAALARSAACVAVIGPRWADDTHRARLARDDDPVRLELVKALAAGITMVPTLVEDAPIPALALLPPALHPLFDIWNARPVSEARWEQDTQALIDEIAAETGLPVGPDLETLLRDAATARQRIAELEQANNLQSGQIDALQGTIRDLTSKLAEANPNERPALAAAFAALAEGNMRAAEDEFEREYEQRKHARQALLRAVADEQKGEADAARNVANLALLHDVAKAVTFYRNALNLEPSNAETSRLLASALVEFGELKEARTALSRSVQLAVAQENSWSEMVALVDIGHVARLQGDLKDANTALLRAAELAERRLEADPDNTRCQHNLSVIHDRIGKVLEDEGNGPRALAAYCHAHTIREALAARDPSDADRQRNLSVSYDNMSDLQWKQGDIAGALAGYRKALAIRTALAARDPANAGHQHDLGFSHDRIGDMLVKKGWTCPVFVDG